MLQKKDDSIDSKDLTKAKSGSDNSVLGLGTVAFIGSAEYMLTHLGLFLCKRLTTLPSKIMVNFLVSGLVAALVDLVNQYVDIKLNKKQEEFDVKKFIYSIRSSMFDRIEKELPNVINYWRGEPAEFTQETNKRLLRKSKRAFASSSPLEDAKKVDNIEDLKYLMLNLIYLI